MNIDCRKKFEYIQIRLTPPAEERLLLTEDSGNAVRLYPTHGKFAQVGWPELVLDEYGDLGLDYIQKHPCVPARGKWQIRHSIYLVVVLAQVVARR